MEIVTLAGGWLDQDVATLRDVQSLRILGKLMFVASCVRPGRVFVSRILNWLRSLHEGRSEVFDIPGEVQKDLLWWSIFLERYNGVSMMALERWSSPDEEFSSDSCLSGCGGFFAGRYFHTVFPEKRVAQALSINALELLQ